MFFQTSLNELVDSLTTKVCSLEVQLCEEQEKCESLKYERDNLEERFNRADHLCKGKRNVYNNTWKICHIECIYLA